MLPCGLTVQVNWKYSLRKRKLWPEGRSTGLGTVSAAPLVLLIVWLPNARTVKSTTSHRCLCNFYVDWDERRAQQGGRPCASEIYIAPESEAGWQAFAPYLRCTEPPPPTPCSPSPLSPTTAAHTMPLSGLFSDALRTCGRIDSKMRSSRAVQSDRLSSSGQPPTTT
ncbi:hypothetical protein OH76DRAFT_605476 [Lentinus brumalis]|uniref:Uncharacterized protein n=1 Tax=Lentinus brumalis TaxID=2498619 RepID=A0A371DUH9_9APHY|nr:hypothetical protein OH76DRAFT_605476 [Polyporus brumalis]